MPAVTRGGIKRERKRERERERERNTERQAVYRQDRGTGRDRQLLRVEKKSRREKEKERENATDGDKDKHKVNLVSELDSLGQKIIIRMIDCKLVPAGKKAIDHKCIMCNQASEIFYFDTTACLFLLQYSVVISKG